MKKLICYIVTVLLVFLMIPYTAFAGFAASTTFAEYPTNEYSSVSSAADDVYLAESEKIDDKNTNIKDNEKKELAERCNSDYGYNDIVNVLQSENMATLYTRIDNAVHEFFMNGGDIGGDTYVYGEIIFSDLGLSIDEVYQVYNVYLHDHPLYFWCDKSVSVIGSTLVLSCYEEYALSSSRSNAISTIVDSISKYEAYCEDSTSNYTTATAIMYLMIQNIDYAYTEEGTPEESVWAHNVVGVFDEHYGEAVCEGYAKAYQLLLNYMEIPNVYVVGMAAGNTDDSDENVHHAWNMVQMDDGKYYVTDVTWNDQDARLDYGYAVERIEDRNQLEDFPYRVYYTYNLCGSSIYDTHYPLTEKNTGDLYLYKLPDVNAEKFNPSIDGEMPIERWNLFYMEPENDYDIIDANEGVFSEGDYQYCVLQNDGIHRTVMLRMTKYGMWDKTVEEFPASVTHEGVTYDVISIRIDTIQPSVDEIIIPEGVKYVLGTFGYDIPTCKSITLPSTLEYLSVPTLSDEGIEEIKIDDNNPYIKSVDGVMYNKDGTVLIRYPAIAKAETFTVPESVDSIYWGAFRGNKHLKHIIFNDGLEYIGPAAFQQSKSLEELIFPNSLETLEKNIISESNVKKIYIPKNTSFSWMALQGSNSIEDIAVEEGNPYGFTYEGALYIGNELCCYSSARETDVLNVHEDCLYIYPWAFRYAKRIGEVVIPDNCKVEPVAFFNSGVETLNISKNNTSIKYDNGAIMSPDGKVLYTYLGGNKNSSYVVPDTVERIYQYAFNNNPYIKSISMTDNVTEIEAYAFAGCTSLETVRLSDSVAWDCDVISYEKFYRGIFEGCKNLIKVNIPKAATHLPYYTFEFCESLEELTIPANIKTIGECALSCEFVKELRIEGSETVPASNTDWTRAIWCIPGINYSKCVIYAPADSKVAEFINNTSELYGVSWRDISIDENTLNTNGSCGDNAFWSIEDGGTALVISGTGAINDYGESSEAPWQWAGAEKITKVIIEEGITKIGNYAFDSMEKIESVVIADSVENIGWLVFANCSSLENVILPDNLTTIGRGAFYNCSKMSEIVLPEKVICLEAECFRKCSNVKNVTLNDSLETIQGHAFAECSSIQGIIIPERVNFIDAGAFQDCVNLNSITLTNYVSYLYKTAFKNVTATVYYNDNINWPKNIIDEINSECPGLTWKEIRHSFTTYVSNNDATCTADGTKTAKCDNCAATNTVTDTGSKLNHSFTNYKSNNDATCTANGTKTAKCDNCAAVKTVIDTGSAKGHVERKDITKASRTADGKILTLCSVCKKQLKSEMIPSIKTVALSYTKKAYTGATIAAPKLTVTDRNGNVITSYTVTGLQNQTKVGQYKVTVKFNGNYDDSVALSYTIVPKKTSSAKAELYGYDDVKFSWSKVTGASGYNVYYKKSSAGSYTFYKATTGTYTTKKDLSDGVKYTFKVVPYYKDAEGKKHYDSAQYKTASVYTLKKLSTPAVSKSGTKVKVKWKNISGESGYQISKSTKKSGTNIVATYKTTSGTYKTISATKGKTYYYKVRAYKIVDGKKIYGPWSAVKLYKRG